MPRKEAQGPVKLKDDLRSGVQSTLDTHVNVCAWVLRIYPAENMAADFLDESASLSPSPVSWFVRR